MSTALSSSSQLQMEWKLHSWLNPLVISLGETKANTLTAEETNAIERYIFAEKWPHVEALRTLYPIAVSGHDIYFSFDAGIQYLTIRQTIHCNRGLPWFQQNSSWNQYSQNHSQAAKIREVLPERILENYAQLDRIATALRDLHERCTEYTQARYLVHQWPGALKFLPEHIQRDLRAHSFKRKPPRKVELLQPETLQTLAWMTVIQPVPA